MKHYEEVQRNISRLEAMIPAGLLAADNWDFKAIWRQIRETSASFKGVRFPTKAQHEEAWSRFQTLVQKVKDKQQERRAKFDQRREASERLRDTLIRRAQNALPDDSGLGDAVLALATGGLSLIVEMTLDALLGPYDKRKQELLQANRALRAVWDEFTSRKGELLRDDKSTVFQALKNEQQKLDGLWSQYKAERQKTLDAYFQEKRRRHKQWRERKLANVRKNQERQSRLEGVLAHKRQHVESLYERLSEARSDSYRARVESWISEEVSAIRDIERKIDDIRGWISEDLGKLND